MIKQITTFEKAKEGEKLLITGSNGLLGQHLIKMLLDTTNHQIIATGRGESRLPFERSSLFNYYTLDIADGIAVNDFIQLHKPTAIIHAAALTQPDPCELDKIACWEINVTATRFLTEAAELVNAYFLYVSTDFVFDGIHGPYTETDTTGPVNYYGSSKLAAEKSVAESNLTWSIVRTVLVFGNILTGNRSNVISWVKNNLETKTPIKVVGDQWRTPTYVKDLAKGILLVLQKKATGIYHISGEEGMSPFDMAIATANYLHLDKSLITKVDATVFTQPAQRPLRTGFIIEKAKQELGFKPLSFKDALKQMLG